MPGDSLSAHNGRDGHAVDEIVEAVAAVPLHPDPLDVAGALELDEWLPQVEVGDRLRSGVAPAVPLPLTYHLSTKHFTT